MAAGDLADDVPEEELAPASPLSATAPAPPPTPVPSGRGGPQRIPRPPGVRRGGPPPWAELPADRRHVRVPDVRRAFNEAGPPRSSPVERLRPRASAVVAALYDGPGPDGDEAHVVLTRRSRHLRSHKGEVSFPGGGQESGDADLTATALREAWEETALDRSAVEVIGELDHLSTISSRSFIVPFVAALPARPDLTPNPREVDAILHVPLSELLADEVWREERWGFGPVVQPIWFFELVGDTIWGATAAMLRQLLGLVTGTVARGDMKHP